ncbi:phage major capsid protein [Paraburkholderia diazotrophica]|uniref:Phage major capsid protein, HK97 family n=1 Tax=Paraburkholderia diazotrophica TaxID=667676 RepID=A0A1H7CDM2_9BURK|nr:phage major capsid protein [Paraburkholderia diazotrophica]SEJ87374.1 phage major capsid protein, HK97 family [Paraburkholderia diazotrophica]
MAELLEQIQEALEKRDGEVQKVITKALADIAALQAKSEQHGVNLIDLAQKVAGRLEGGSGGGAGGGSETLGDLVTKSDMLTRWKSGDARVVRAEVPFNLHSKAAILSNVGDATAGFPVMPDFQVAPSLAVPRFWRALYSRPTSSNAIETVTATPGGATGADAVSEGALKPEASLSYGPATVPVVTVAYWALCSRQLMEDSAAFGMYLNGEMRNGLDAKIDAEVINGSGVAPHMEGLVSASTPWVPAAGSIGFDQLISAVVTLRANGASKVVIGTSIADYLATMLVKTSTGEYVISPGANLLAMIGAVIVPCSAVPAGNFTAVGTPEGAYIALRNDIVVEVSREDMDNFRKNLVTTLVEARMALVVQRPNLCLYGPLTPPVVPLAVAKKS